MLITVRDPMLNPLAPHLLLAVLLLGEVVLRSAKTP